MSLLAMLHRCKCCLTSCSKVCTVNGEVYVGWSCEQDQYGQPVCDDPCIEWKPLPNTCMSDPEAASCCKHEPESYGDSAGSITFKVNEAADPETFEFSGACLRCIYFDNWDTGCSCGSLVIRSELRGTQVKNGICSDFKLTYGVGVLQIVAPQFDCNDITVENPGSSNYPWPYADCPFFCDDWWNATNYPVASRFATFILSQYNTDEIADKTGTCDYCQCGTGSLIRSINVSGCRCLSGAISLNSNSSYVLHRYGATGNIVNVLSWNITQGGLKITEQFNYPCS